MIQMTVKLDTKQLSRLAANVDRVELVVGKAAADVEAHASKSIAMSSGKHKEYIRRGVSHWSSPPGSPPNSDTGKLKDGIGHRQVTKTVYEVFSDQEYAIPLEMGWMMKTKTGVKYIPPRPFMVPAIRAIEPSFKQALTVVLGGRKKSV